MAAILPGYEYDVFISYRHNDNLNGWVTDFVQNLEKELKGTLKHSVSIYFDSNPRDGLLETHNVDKSLEGKLKCLIFIPIISQTYCDPKSFAWQHEFCAFNKLANGDPLGREIRLGNGNVTSRILPVKIHDLDGDDNAMVENEIGGRLRGIEFIYSSPGVNRPLKMDDPRKENGNHTFYGDQINKVANAVKEIISAISAPVSNVSISAKRPVSENQDRNRRWKKVVLASCITIVLIVLIYGGSQIIRETREEPQVLEKSIAVLPFADLSPGGDQSWFSDGLTEEILNSLTHVEGLNVIATTSSSAFKDSKLPIPRIADSLHVNYIVQGTVRESRDKKRISAKLISARDGIQIWSHNFDHAATEDILAVQHDIALQIASNLGVYLDPATKGNMEWAGTSNPDAFLSFLQGKKVIEEFDLGPRTDLSKLQKANVWFEKAIESDPEFVNPYFYNCRFYLRYLNRYDQNERPDTLSREEAYRIFNANLENTITKSKGEVDKDYFRLCKIMYSDDWTGIRPVIERILANPDAVRLFSFRPLYPQILMIALGYSKEIETVSRQILTRDPFNIYAIDDIMSSLVFSSQWKEANAFLDSASDILGEDKYRRDKIILLLQEGQTREAVRLTEQWGNAYQSNNPTMMALLYAKTGKMQEAEEQFKQFRGSPFLKLWIINELHRRTEANREAAILDKRLLIALPLIDSYIGLPGQLPFDLSATPNFARRLKQAGVLPE